MSKGETAARLETVSVLDEGYSLPGGAYAKARQANEESIKACEDYWISVDDCKRKLQIWMGAREEANRLIDELNGER